MAQVSDTGLDAVTRRDEANIAVQYVAVLQAPGFFSAYPRYKRRFSGGRNFIHKYLNEGTAAVGEVAYPIVKCTKCTMQALTRQQL